MSVPPGLDADLADAAAALDDAVASAGLQGRFTSGYRSRAQQERLYRSFLSGRNPYPVAPPGFSAHEYGWAFDYVVSPPEWQRPVGSYWQSVGGVWGGSQDPVHFELPGASAEAKRLGQQELDDLAAAGKVPWWFDVATLPLPSVLMTKSAECQVVLPPDDFRCRYFSFMFCCK